MGRETTYGTSPGTLYASRFKDPGVLATLTQEQLENEGTSTREFDALLTVQGLKSWTLDAAFDVRPENTQLVTATTPSVSWMTELLYAACGGSSVLAGSLVVSSTTSSITVTATHGTRFVVGTPIAAQVSGTLEWAIITAISGDVLTCWPSFSGAPTITTGLVVNSASNWLTETSSQSLAVTCAQVQSSNAQWTLNCGIITELGLSIPAMGKGLLSGSVKLAGKTWVGPSPQSLGTSVITEVLTNPISCRDAYFILQPAATTTRVAYPIISADVKLTTGNTHLEEFSGVNEQTSGTMRVAPRMVGTISLKCRYDQQIETYYAAQTQLVCVLVVPYGSLLTKRFVVLHMGTTFIDAKPVVADEGGRLVHQFNLRAQLSTLNASSTAGTAAAPWVLGRI